jgi:hypothetical protein
MDLQALLHFPKPPFRIDQSLAISPPPGTTIATYLQQIRAWRSAVVQFLDTMKLGAALDADGLSTRAQLALATYLEIKRPEQISRYAPSNITAFPAQALERVETPNLEDVMEVLRWRGAVKDYLAFCDLPDLDAIGEFLSPACGEIGQFLSPACAESVCDFCLTEIAPGTRNVYEHNCLILDYIRPNWPAPPPSFQRWMTEATQPSVPKKWWQFWKISS